MNKTDAIETLAEMLIFKKREVNNDTLNRLGLIIKPGKELKDVLEASYLREGQCPGDFERMVAHVERNLKDVVE